MTKVLIGDDDAKLIDVLGDELRQDGYTVVEARNGLQAMQLWKAEAPEAMLLDAQLPKLNGFEVCRSVRLDSTIPVILLSESLREEDAVRGFELGADDYVSKSVSIRQLVVRLEALLRRVQMCRAEGQEHLIKVGALCVDIESHEATYGGRPIALTPLELRILYVLASNYGWTVPFARLSEHVWGYTGPTIPSSLKIHVSHIRQKLAVTTEGKLGVRLVRGVGYSLVDNTGAGS